MAPSVTNSVVSPELVADFERDGFVVVPDLLTDEELDRFGPVVDAAVGRRQAADQRPLAERSRYEQSFVQCMNLWEGDPEVRPLTFHPRVAAAAAELLRADAIRLWHDQALYKEAGGRATDAHQDQPYWPIAEPNTITAWIPFDGSTLANGAMGYVAGSHAIGLRRFVNIFFGEPEDLLARPELTDADPTFVEVPRGAVAFHHGLTAHLAGPNTTDAGRRVHTMIFFADGCTRGFEHPHFAVDRAGIGLGEVIRSDVPPIAWPREPGDLPPTPAVPFLIDIKGAEAIVNSGAIPRPSGDDS
jgi:ectoine hydroxylase-related dioxygenase (phytanoyl-CoA dioxygenase family)